MADNGFDEIRIDDAITYGMKGGPAFNTRITKVSSGGEQRTPLWPDALCRYEVAFGDPQEPTDLTQIMALNAFFRCRQGMARGFRFKDWLDFEATMQPLVNSGAGNGPLQLQVTYSDGFTNVVRKIVKPTNTPSDTRAEAGIDLFRSADGGATWAQMAGGSFTCDYTTGLVALAAPDAAQYAWTGEFDVPVRLDLDAMTAAWLEWGEYSWPTVKLIEILI